MNSPYMSAGQGEQYTVPGLAALLADRNKRNDAAMKQIGQVSGGLAAGAVGGVQAYKDPSAFGDGTSSGFAALKGAAMNYGNATTGTGTNFKQFAAMGKAADGVREALRASTPSLPDESPAVLGMTDEQWKHAGTDRKVAALQGWQQAQTAKAQIQAYDLGQLHMQQAQEQHAAQQADREAWQRYSAGAAALTRPVPLAENPMTPSGPVQSPALQMFANAAANPQPLNGQEMMLLAQRAGVNPQDTLLLGKTAAEYAKAQREAGGEDNVPKGVTLNGTPVIYSPKGGQFQIDPAYSMQQKTAAAKDLLTQRMGSLSVSDQLKSLNQQEKLLTSKEAMVMLDDVDRAARIAAVQQRRKELQDAAGGKPAAPSGSAVRRYNPTTGKIE